MRVGMDSSPRTTRLLFENVGNPTSCLVRSRRLGVAELQLAREQETDAGNAPVEVALDFVLPEPQDAPSVTSELRKVPTVSAPIPFDFRLPKCREPIAPLWISIAMPEVAIDENDEARFAED